MEYIDSPGVCAAAALSIVLLSMLTAQVYARRTRRRIAALESAGRSREIFLAVLSHELRGALTAVLGWLEAGRVHMDDPLLLRKALDIALRNARQQARIIDDLLDVSRLVSGKLQIERQPLDLARLARDAVDAARPSAVERQIELRCALHEPVFIEGDPRRMLQVMGNLLGNAIKFTRPGGWVDLRLERAQAQARLVVSDNGVGIAAQALPHIFELFWQADAAQPIRQRGLGLGLPLVHGIVERHRGRIRAESAGPGRGARFTVELPALAVLPASALAAAAAADEKEPALNGLGVVALDHDDDTLGWLQHLFASHGAMTWTARSMEEAVALVEREHADVLISDFAVVEGGDELIRALHSLKAGNRVAAIAFSNRPTEEECGRALSAGYDCFVAKPCDPAVLLRAVRDVVDRRAP